MDSSNPAGASLLGGLLVAALIVWFLWDLFFASVDLLVLADGVPWVAAAAAVALSLHYSAYRLRRYQERGY